MSNPSYQFQPYLPGIDHPYTNGIIPGAVNDGWLKQYTPEIQAELAARFDIDVMEYLHHDYQTLHIIRFGGVTLPQPYEERLYVASAGSPCSGKSWELDEELDNVAKDERYTNLVQIDPDRWVMLQMGLYKELLKQGATPEEAYNFARPASNIIANMFLNEAVHRGFHIAHGTTMTGPHAGNLLQSLRNEGYATRVLAVYAPVDARLAMRDHRIETEGFYQVTPEDFVTKADAFMERMPVYFNPALVNDLCLMWKGDVLTPAQTAAHFTPTRESINNGILLQFEEAYRDFLEPFRKRAGQNSGSTAMFVPDAWHTLLGQRSGVVTSGNLAPMPEGMKPRA